MRKKKPKKKRTQRNKRQPKNAQGTKVKFPGLRRKRDQEEEETANRPN